MSLMLSLLQNISIATMLHAIHCRKHLHHFCVNLTWDNRMTLPLHLVSRSQCGPDTITITLADRRAVKWQVLVERLNENVCTATFEPLNPGHTHWLIMHFLLSSASSLLVPPGLGHIVIIRKDCKFAPIIQKLTACVLSNVTITTFAGCDVPPVLWLWLNMRLHWQVTKHSRFPAIYITRCLW